MYGILQVFAADVVSHLTASSICDFKKPPSSSSYPYLVLHILFSLLSQFIERDFNRIVQQKYLGWDETIGGPTALDTY